MDIKSTPEISVNPLAEYVVATESRRRTIIRQQRKPSSFIVPRYRTARAAFSKYFVKGYDKSVLIDAIERLQTREQKSDWTKNDTANSILALRHFLSLRFPFEGLKCRFSKPSVKSYTINGVHVIISPDLILEWERNGQKYVGAIKFFVKKTKTKTEMAYQQGRIAASLLADFVTRISAEGTTISKSHCLCIDVMNERIFPAPETMLDDMVLVSDACEEIRINWLAS